MAKKKCKRQSARRSARKRRPIKRGRGFGDFLNGLGDVLGTVVPLGLNLAASTGVGGPGVGLLSQYLNAPRSGGRTNRRGGSWANHVLTDFIKSQRAGRGLFDHLTKLGNTGSSQCYINAKFPSPEAAQRWKADCLARAAQKIA